MGDLRVTRDGAFYGVTIRGVLESGAGSRSTSPSARSAPSGATRPIPRPDPAAGSAPRRRRNAELELRFTREKVHARAVAQLEAWRAEPPPNLVGVSSVEQQYVGLIDQDVGDGVGIQHTEERQDRSAARAYATWSSGKLKTAAEPRGRPARRVSG